MTERPSSKELAKGPVKGEIAEDVNTLGEGYQQSHSQRGFLYKATVFGVRGVLQVAIMVIILIGASFLMTELQESREERPQRAKTEAVYTIETVKAELSNHRPVISVFGDIVAARTLNVTSLVAGEVIFVNDALKVGGKIKKGDTLLEINPFSFEIARDEARANLKEAEAALQESEARLLMEETGLKRAKEQFDLARVDLERSREIVGQGIVTQRVVEERELILSQRRAAFQTSGANIEIQKAQIEARKASLLRTQVMVRDAEQALKNTKLTAPFDALVQTTSVEVGQTVATNLTLATLFSANEFDARFVLSDGQFGRLVNDDAEFVGREVMVHWSVGDEKSSFTAIIDRVGAEVAANRGGVTVFARLRASDLAGSLRPGAFVTVDVPDQTFEKTFRLPETAVFEGEIAYVVGGDNRLEARPIEIAVYDDDNVIVKSGLESGEEVLITQIAEVGPGLLVRLIGQEKRDPKEKSQKKKIEEKEGVKATSVKSTNRKPQG